MVVGDWGSAHLGPFVSHGPDMTYFGGTPVYAGPNTFTFDNKDFFSFSRLAMELMCGKKEQSQLSQV